MEEKNNISEIKENIDVSEAKENKTGVKKKSLTVNYIFSIIKSVMSFVFPMVSFPYASRILGVSNLGIVGYCTSFLSYFSLFASLGIVIYATREGAKYRDDKEELSKFSKEVFLINLISTTIVYGVFLVVLFFATEEKYFLVMLICSLSMWFTLFGMEWLYQIEEEFTYISIRSMVFQVLSLILLFVLVKEEKDYVQYAIIHVFASGGSSILNAINSRKYINWKNVRKLELTKHLKSIFIIFGISAASSIYINLDTVMLKWIKSEYEVGLYTAAVKLNSMIKTVVNSLSVVLLARLSSFVNKKEDKEYKKLLTNAFSINLAVAIPCATGMFMIAKNIILIMSGPDYVGAEMASKILAINLVFAIIDGMIYYQIMLPFNKDKLACVATIIGAIINLILNAILIPLFSIEGASWATLFSEMAVMISFIVILRKEINVIGLMKEVPKLLLSALPIVVTCYIVEKLCSQMIIQTIISVLISGILYLVFMIITKATLAEEMLKILKRFKGKK